MRIRHEESVVLCRFRSLALNGVKSGEKRKRTALLEFKMPFSTTRDMREKSAYLEGIEAAV
uniref:Uncharacterized protein n=1 Tax=Daphnia magna TaxID=35525 RepID=A0A0P6B0E9_9CRUS